MAYNSLAELFTATADSIRSKTGGSEKIVANDFPAAIAAIETGGGGGGGQALLPYPVKHVSLATSAFTISGDVEYIPYMCPIPVFSYEEVTA